jgi:acyl-CoA dehydrogenase
MANYFFAPADYPEVAQQNQASNDDFLFNQGPTKGLGKIRFHDYNIAYSSRDTANIEVFREQIAAFKGMLFAAAPDDAQRKDIDFLLAAGEVFALVVYGQLILENAKAYDVSDDVIDQIFDFMVRDFSRHALSLYSKPSSSEKQMASCLEMIRKPVLDDARYQRVWQQVHDLRDEYEMNP